MTDQKKAERQPLRIPLPPHDAMADLMKVPPPPEKRRRGGKAKQNSDQVKRRKGWRPLTSPRQTLLRMVEMFATGNMAALNETIAEEYVDHQGLGEGDLRGRAGFASVVSSARAGLSDLAISVADTVEQDDRVTARIHWHGKRRDGTPLERETIDTIRINGHGLAVEHWGTRLTPDANLSYLD